MDQLQPTTSALPNELMVPVASHSSVRTSIQSLKPDEEMTAPLDQYGDVLQNVGINSSSLPVTPMINYSGFQQLIIPNSASGNSGVIFNNLKPVTVHMPVKRKSSMENVPAHLLSPRKVMPSKKMGLLEHRPWLNIYSPTQSNVQHHLQSLAGVLASQQWATKKKRTTKFVPGPPRSGFPKCSTPRSLPIQGRLSPRVQNEPNETVRSKLRESISAALALVNEKEKSLSTKDTSTTAGATASEQIQEVFQSAEFASSVISAELPVGKPKETNEDCSTECENNMKSQLSAIPSNLTDNNLLHTHESVDNELSIADMMQYEEPIDGNFFVKDDLLQGNGLSWVLDFDAWVAEKEGHEPEKQNIGETVVEAPEVKNTNSPQTLALQIELELFKLFDGVNKKYKEKGRSLLFNLKDKNNPELREKVMSGEISPAHLCKMTAEELASKELSEWRIAKAEEFEHLKILPDSDIDIRRLVKKTHKGEYQLEVEEYDVSVSVEVSVASSSLPRILSETNETKSPSVPISAGDQMDTVNDKINSEVQNLCTTTVPTNISSDLMQGIIEDDLKDPKFLPPIVSLDEFMESRQTETPFKNVSVDADKTAASLDNAHSEVPLETKSSKLSTDNHTDSKNQKQDTDTEPTDSQLETTISHPVAVSKGERIWEGILQLSNSSKISVSGFFKSGEKVSTKDWCRALEIKGRVRMDAFEKFLLDLNKSRSRAIMVMHLILKESEGKESESLSQVVDSYVSADRVGYAEPVRGLEAYLCPCHPKIMDRIKKHLSKGSESLSFADGDKGLIGVFIWRKAHASPNSSSHPKHNLKKHQQEHKTSSRRNNHHQKRNMNADSSYYKPKHPTVPFVPPKVTSSLPMIVAIVEDDVPPGFGQPASQEDDDLPEFNFSSELNLTAPTQKVFVAPQNQNSQTDEMRQLIERYGPKSALVLEPWDDNDDIPEWQPPQMSLAPAPQPFLPTPHIYQQPNQPMLPQLINQQRSQQLQGAPLPQFPTGATQPNITPSWPQQQHQDCLWMNLQGAKPSQFYGTQSRGF